MTPKDFAAKNSKRLRVRVTPDWRRENPYQEMLAAGLLQAGCDVDFASYAVGFFALNRLIPVGSHVDALHLHWEHPLLHWVMWSRNPAIRAAKHFCFWLDAIILRARGVHLVWTIHNRVSHESTYPEGEAMLRKTLARSVSRIIVHSAGALRALQDDYGAEVLNSAKAAVIPHGNYEGYYERSQDGTVGLSKRHSLGALTTTILLFGALRRYKGLSRLLTIFPSVSRSDLRLLIAGRPADSAMASELQAAAAADPRIHLHLEFVQDSEVNEYFEVADVVVIPFERTLSSGSVLLAMTMGRALILPSDAMLLDTPGKQGALYFQSDAEFRNLLDKLDKTHLAALGKFNRNIALALSWAQIGLLTRQVYSKSG